MPEKTQITTRLIKDGAITRDKLDTATTGKAVIRKIVEAASSGIKIKQNSGVDAGTGDVQLEADLDYLSTKFLPIEGGTITPNGTITAYDFIWSSDKTLKKKIRSLKPQFLDIDYKEYEFRDRSGRKRYGVLADDVETILPDLVTVGRNGKKGVSYLDLLIMEIVYLKAEVHKLKQSLNGHP
jgi:hypothetical protein